jgi:hypothetical protein
VRLIDFEVLPALGPDGEIESGTPVDLLRHIPYLLAMQLLPPLVVVNDLLSRGEVDAGMSGGARWTPFSLDEEEWREIADILKAEDRVVDEAVPEWAQSMADWPIWVMERRFGVPADEHRRLSDRAEVLRVQRDAAREDQERYLELHVAFVRAEEELGEFITRYIRTTRP